LTTAIGQGEVGLHLRKCRAVFNRPSRHGASDLFRLACPIVGALICCARIHSRWPPNIPEFGTVKNKAEFDALREMSTYEHISPEPPTRRFCSPRYNDPRFPLDVSQKRRLDSKQIRRMASRFYWTSTTAAGNGIGNTRAQQICRFNGCTRFYALAFGDPGVSASKPKF